MVIGTEARLKCNAKFQAIYIPHNACSCLNHTILGMNHAKHPHLYHPINACLRLYNIHLRTRRLNPHALPHARQIRVCCSVRHSRQRQIGTLCRRQPNLHLARYPMGGTAGPYAQLSVLPAGRCRPLLRPALNLATSHRQFGHQPCRSGRYPAKRLHAACTCLA